MQDHLSKQFDAAMFEIYRRAKLEAGYKATIFLRMINDRGGLATAKYLVNSPTPSDGYTHLYERGRLDLIVSGVDRAANGLGRPLLQGRASGAGLSRRPKNLGPFQREPVIAKATLDRLVLPFQENPSASTMTRCRWRSHSRVSRVPGFNSILDRWRSATSRSVSSKDPDPIRSSRRLGGGGQCTSQYQPERLPR
jgi:hypothetical protein